MAIMLALSFSVTFAEEEKDNATSINTTTNLTMQQNMTNVTNETMNMTNATDPFAKANGIVTKPRPKLDPR